MGCSCSSIRRIRKIGEKAENNQRDIKYNDIAISNQGEKNVIDVATNLSSTVQNPPNNHYNIIVWATNYESYKGYFPKSYTSYLTSTGQIITFSLIYLKPNQTLNILSIDCILFILPVNTEPQIIETIKSFCIKHKNICMKLAIGLKSFKRLEELNIKTINTIEFFYQEFLTQDIHLNEVLKGIFESLDSDLNGNIDFDEAKTGLKKIDDSITTDQIKEYMKTIDFNKEGKISFYEFSHLWKRGRQGDRSLENIQKIWTEKIEKFLPNMSPFYEKKKINTNKKNVQLKINFGEQYESKLGVTVFIGRSSKREEVLRDVNNLFGLNIHECWAVFQLKHKNETMASSTLIKAEEIFQSTKSSILNTTVHGKDIFDSISLKSEPGEIRIIEVCPEATISGPFCV